MAGRGISSYGRLIDPLVELRGAAAAGASSPIMSWNLWRRERREKSTNKEALNRLMLADKAFRTDTFLSAARQGYTDVIDAITANRLHAITPLVTEPCFLSIKRGVEAGIAETGFRQGATIVDWVEAPNIVYARAGWLAGEINRSAMEPPDVAQLTVRTVTLQAPKASSLSGRDRELEADSVAPPDPNTALGEWTPVLDDGGSGHVFYWNRVTGAVSWKKPTSAQWVTGRLPFRIETAGMSREVAAAPAPAAASNSSSGGGSGGSGVPLVKVVHNVVWERIIRKGAPPGLWRIAKL